MAKSVTNSLVLSILVIFFLPSARAVYNIVTFGAIADGRTDSSKAFLGAWSAACGSTGPSTIYVPSGTFLINQATFLGPCKSSTIAIQINGTLVASSGYANQGQEWILFNKVDGVSIYGGTIDGQGASLWACKASGKNCPTGASSLVFSNSKNIVINGLTSINSKFYHIVIHALSQGVTVQGVKIIAPGKSPNTDGIHVQTASNVAISGSSITTGDDCISIGPGTTNLWIENINCGPGHGISIGSLGQTNQEKGVQNITVKSTVFTGTQNGLRIKTWARPSVGFVRDILFEHATMQNVQNPIIITQHYCNDNSGCPGQNSGVKISGVTYNDIHGSSATPVAINFDCSATNPCSGIALQNITLTYTNGQAKSSCKYVTGSTSGSVIPNSCL